MNDRIDELEIKVAFQDKVIADLEALVRGLGIRLDDAVRELQQLKAAIGSPELAVGGANEKPPHY